jgi:hypothetical protein
MNVSLIYTSIQTRTLAPINTVQNVLQGLNSVGTRVVGTGSTRMNGYSPGDAIRITCTGTITVGPTLPAPASLTLYVQFKPGVTVSTVATVLDPVAAQTDYPFLLTALVTFRDDNRQVQADSIWYFGSLVITQGDTTEIESALETNILVPDPATIEIAALWSLADPNLNCDFDQCLIEYLFPGGFPIS